MAGKIKVKIANLYSLPEKIDETLIDLEEGRLSRTKGPIRVSKIGKGKYFILDGHHRVIEDLYDGKENMLAELDKYIPDMTRTGGAYTHMISEAIPIKAG